MKHKKASNGIFVDVAVLIVCLAIATSCLASGMFAKFVSKSAGADLARVASFNVNATMNDDGGEDTLTRSYKINLTNRSETAVRYTVTLTFETDVSEIVIAKLNGIEVEPGPDGTTFVWENAGIVPANTASAEVPLVLIIDDPTAGGTYDFNVSVSFEQVN